MQPNKKIGNHLIVMLLTANLMLLLMFVLPNINNVDTLFIWAMILFACVILYGSYRLIKYGKSGKIIICMVVAATILTIQIMLIIALSNMCVIC